MLEDIIETQRALVQDLQSQARTIPSLEKMQQLESAIAGLRELIETQAVVEVEEKLASTREQSIKEFEARRQELRKNFGKSM